MSGELFFYLLMGGLLISSIIILFYLKNQIQVAKRQLHKLVQQVGGQDIVIRRDDQWGQRGLLQFVIWYVGANGVKHKHRVTRHLDIWGGLKGDFFWDKPLQPASSEPETTCINSKEQLISEMDAEIERLQEELRLAHRED